MPLSVAAFTAQTTHVTLTIGEGTLEVDWRPKAVDGEMLGRLQSLKRLKDLPDDEQVEALELAATLILKLIARWDLVEYIEDDGALGPVIALTPERLRQCSLDLLWTILNALLDESQMGEANGTPPSTPSRRTSRTVTPTGSSH